jgi:endonuclease/exonuclease/phosphatase family metal-dependent hydrolase
MRARVLVLSCLLFPLTLTAQRGRDEAPPEPLLLDVMSFNIRTAAGRDGDNAWTFRKELVAETIRRYSPDVMGLQEALTEQIEFLEAALPEYRWLGVDRGLNGGVGLSEFTPIFYRYRELSPIESGTFWLSDTPDFPTRGRGSAGRGSARIVTWARFYHLATSRQIYVFNTHFSSRRGDRQLRAVEQITSHIAALPAESTVIAMGDFNAIAGTSDTWKVATSNGLRDAWLLAEERRGPALTANGFAPPPDGWEGRIDWILVEGPISVPEMETVVYEREGRYPSDHYPVVAKLVLDRGLPSAGR